MFQITFAEKYFVFFIILALFYLLIDGVLFFSVSVFLKDLGFININYEVFLDIALTSLFPQFKL